MAKIPDFQTWTQHTSTFPSKSVPSRPGYTDGSQTGTNITALGPNILMKRIGDHNWFTSNVANHNSGADWSLRHMYARKQVWNSDGTKILFNSSSRFHTVLNSDGTYYRTAAQAQKYPVWANTSPWHIYGTTEGSTSSLRRTDIRDDTFTDIINVGYSATIGESEGDISKDDSKVVLTNNNGGNIRLACIDIPNGTMHEINISRAFSSLDWAGVTPLGNYVIVAYDTTTGGARNVDLYTWAGAFVRRITNQQHGDTGLDENGDECWYSIGHIEESAGTGVVKCHLASGTNTVVFGGDNEFPNTSGQPILDGHLSASCTVWGVPHVVISAFSSSGGPHVVFGVKVDGSRQVCYYGFHNSNVGNYYAQPQANVSRDGVYGITASNWNGSVSYNDSYLMWDDSTSDAPVLDDPTDVSTTGGQSGTFQLSATDPQGDTVNYSTNGAVESWITCSNSGLVTYSPPTSVSGFFEASFISNNGSNSSNIVDVGFTVAAADIGTETSFQVITVNPDNTDVSTASGQTWAESTAETGYTGTNLLVATAGFNSPADLTAGVIGYFDVDLTGLPVGSWHVYIRLYATSGSNDSFWVSVNGEVMDKDQPIYDAQGYTWQSLRDTNNLSQEKLVSSSDVSMRFYPREQTAGVDRIVFVEASETSAPTGTKGFEHVAAGGNNPPVLVDPANVSVNAGASGSFQLSASDADGDGITYSVSGSSISWITCSSTGLVSYNPSQGISGVHTVSFVATDGTSNSNIESVTFTVEAFDQYAVSIDISGGTQNFDMGRSLQSIGVVTQTNYPPDLNGHYVYISGSGNQASQQSGTESKLNTYLSQDSWNTSTKQGWRGFRTKKRWDWLDSGSENAHLTNILNTCDNNNSYLFVEIDDVNFGLSADSSKSNYATVSKSFAPRWIEDAGGASVGGNPSNLAAGGNLWVAWVMDEFIKTIKAIHDHCKSHSSYAGIVLPETTRSEYTGGGLGNSSNFQNVDSPFYTQYKRMVTELKAYMPDHLIIPSPNYMGSFLPTLIDDFDAIGGIGISTPDTNQFHDPLNPNASEVIDVFTYMRAKRSEMLIAPSVQTRDADDYPDDAYNMCYDSPYTSDDLNPHIMFWYLSHPDVDDSVWANRVKNKLRSVNWHRNPNTPNELSGGTSSSGSNAVHTNLGFNGTNLNLSAKLGTTITDTDSFTVVFSDDPNGSQVINVTFYDSDPMGIGDNTGTQTVYESFRAKPLTGHVVSQGVPNWIASTQYTGFSGNYHLISANGTNIPGNTNCDYIPVDLSSILPSTGSYHMYARVAAADGSSDSIWADVDGEGMTQDQPVYDSDGAFHYQTFRQTTDVTQERLVSASDGVIRWYPREINAGLDSFVFVESAEAALPTGSVGFITYLWPGNTTVTMPEDQVIAVGQGLTSVIKVVTDASLIGFGMAYSFEDINGDPSSLLNGINSSLSGSGPYDYTVDVTGATAGECFLRVTLTDSSTPTNTVTGRMRINVLDPATLTWPEGTSATLPETIEIVKGGTFSIDADPQNISGIALESNRWSISSTKLTINASSDEVGNFTANEVGTENISYIMRRTSDSREPVIYNTQVIIRSAQTINPDSFTVKNNQASALLDVLENDVQTRITSFTNPASGGLSLSTDSKNLYYAPTIGFVGSTTFSYTADDGTGGDIATTNVEIQVVDPNSFDGSFVGTIGIGRYAVRGASIPFEHITLDNPENYGVGYLWTHDFGAMASFKNDVINEPRAVLQINSDNITLADVLSSVHCEVFEI